MNNLKRPWQTQSAKRTIILLFVSVAIFYNSPNLFAQMHALSFGNMLYEDLTIVLATINDVTEANVPSNDDPQEEVSGFRFRLDFVETIRTGQMPPSVHKLEVPFSPDEYTTHWHFDNKPSNGMKVIAHLKKLKSGEFKVFNWRGAIIPLNDFKQPIVELTREICQLWKVDNPVKRLEKIIAGCRGNTAIHSYCSRALGDLDGTWTKLNLKDVIDQPLAYSIIFEPFASTAPVSLEKFSICEYRFGNKFRGQGWGQYEPRYHLISRCANKIITDGQPIHHNTFDAMMTSLCLYPEHSRENYQRLMKVLRGKVGVYKFGTATMLARIYQPHTTDRKMQDLNEEIYDTLAKMVSEDEELADGAAIAIGNIAVSYSVVGPVPDKFMKLLEYKTDFEILKVARHRMRRALKKVQAEKPPKLDADVAVLSYPWDNLIGKKVFVYAYTNFRSGQHGASAEFRGQRFWLDGVENWPDEIFGRSPVQITGRLTKVADLPVFRYEVGQPFGKGLPVPEGYSLEKASTRYVLLEPSWKAITK